jgi:hypothetical protein
VRTPNIASMVASRFVSNFFVPAILASNGSTSSRVSRCGRGTSADAVSK